MIMSEKIFQIDKLFNKISGEYYSLNSVRDILEEIVNYFK